MLEPLDFTGFPLSSVITIESNSFNVYPVPASYDVTIESNNSTVNSYELFDLNGKKVNENKFYQNTKLNLSHLAKGTYFLKIHDGYGYINKKIVIE